MTTKLISSALNATISLGLGISISGYLVPSGEFVYALDYLSQLMGYASNYYGRLFSTDLQNTKNRSKRLKLFTDKGFKPYRILVKDLSRSKKPVRVIRFDDLCLIVEVEAEQGNPKAIALLTSAFRELLRGRTQEAFGLPQDSLSKRLAIYKVNYDHYLEDKQELEELHLPGDEVGGYELVSGLGLRWANLEDLYPEYLG